MAASYSPNAIIIGAGPGGISLAYRLRYELGFEDFLIYDKLDGVGGTWRTNTYPGCGCDLPSHLYSFSFNLNPNWSKELCEQPEILQYIEDTVDRFDLRKHVITSVECTGASWDEECQEWAVALRDNKTGLEFVRRATILVSAVGAISFPRDIQFPGMHRFQGPMMHTARWDHSIDYTGKRVAVIGNGCSAAQVVPAMAQKAGFPNHQFSAFEKWSLRWIPLLQRWLRLRIFLQAEAESDTYFPSPEGIQARLEAEEESKKYIHSRTPGKYWKFIVPDFPLGCKRRIFDPDYLDSLHRKNVELRNEGIQEFTERGIIGTSGDEFEADIIILATGFQVSQFLTPMEITGRRGASLNRQWEESRGAQAYFGTYVHNFPNMAIIFGPNTFPANNSALFACETQVAYAVKSLFTPILDRCASMVEVKQSAEEKHTNLIQLRLKDTVFAGDCSNWYIGKHGRNAASWPGRAASLWMETYFPDWSAFTLTGGLWTWPLYRLRRWLRVRWSVRLGVLLAGLALLSARKGYGWVFARRVLEDRIKWLGL
ncbi:monooxygenase [Aspergillus steynii IBT 23096]|uniref:Monooxygenase n=1 Tax=Aspergillus steynii IBT 23096 TaxID=1392250 RepID=A0A2I2G3Y8_9EURO|nr:monooxygenase [Aspergillus steynii IBT 23096]PLB47594.1 monooxygenase [Aspergillus steynii IBT 23096]